MSVDFIPGTFLDANVLIGMSSRLEMTSRHILYPIESLHSSQRDYTQVLGDLNVASSVSRAQSFESTNHIQTSH